MDKKLSERILASAGAKKASLVLKHGTVVNVFTAGLEQAEPQHEAECQVRGHIHLESSMVAPGEFERTVIPHGTQAVITDPHEIANVAGTQGIQFMMERTEGLTLDVFFMLPSCVPATGLDESGAVLSADKLEPFYKEERVLGLAELMNSYGTTRADRGILDKLSGALDRNKLVDGHAPGLSGKELNAYVTAGACW